MKTTENISLAGYAFTIETEAYEALGKYLSDIRKGFEGNPSAEEIASDIEERIAELLNERCSTGMVVNINMIEDVKKRIGDPETLAQAEVDTSNPAGQSDTARTENKSGKERKLYRNMEDRVFGGVCSGLGVYFGIDKVIFRLIFLLIFFFGFFNDAQGLFGVSTFAYICLWIAMPAARTVEQRCEMHGKPLNLNGFRSKDFNLDKEMKDVAQSPLGQTFKRAGGVFLGLILLLCGLGGLLGGIMIPTLPTLIGHEIAEEILETDLPLRGEELLIANIASGSTLWNLVLVMVSIACVGMLYGGIMLLFDLKSPSWRPGLIIFIAWLISMFMIAGWIVKTVADTLPSLI